MNKKQLLEHIGNIDDKLVEQAEHIPNYEQQRRLKRIRRLLTSAAAIALILGSFIMGAVTFARKIVVEVPVEQVTLTLDEIDLTIIFPESWKGKYSMEKYGNQNYVIYNTDVRETVSEGIDQFDGGVLFYIVCYDETMTLEQFEKKGYDVTGYHYLFTTSDRTYILHEVSDVQWNPEDTKHEAYLQMVSEVKDIRFVVDNVLEDKK